MKTTDAIDELIKRTVRSKRYASRLMRRSDCYLSNMTSSNRDCGASILAELAESVGWKLWLVDPEGDYIEIDPANIHE